MTYLLCFSQKINSLPPEKLTKMVVQWFLPPEKWWLGNDGNEFCFWKAAYFMQGETNPRVHDVSSIQGYTQQRSSGRASCHKSYSNQMLIHHELLGTLKSENDVKIDVFDFLTNQYFGLLVGIWKFVSEMMRWCKISNLQGRLHLFWAVLVSFHHFHLCFFLAEGTVRSRSTRWLRRGVQKYVCLVGTSYIIRCWKNRWNTSISCPLATDLAMRKARVAIGHTFTNGVNNRTCHSDSNASDTVLPTKNSTLTVFLLRGSNKNHIIQLMEKSGDHHLENINRCK